MHGRDFSSYMNDPGTAEAIVVGGGPVELAPAVELGRKGV